MLLNSKNIIIMGIIAFIAMSFWSLMYMPMDMNGKMMHCPFMDDSASFCQMTISDHINAWQRSFALMQEKNLMASLSFLLFSLLVRLFFVHKIQDIIKYQQPRHYLYRYKPEIKLFNYLVLAFSQGIINPKIYA